MSDMETLIKLIKDNREAIIRYEERFKSHQEFCADNFREIRNEFEAVKVQSDNIYDEITQYKSFLRGIRWIALVTGGIVGWIIHEWDTLVDLIRGLYYR